ncbi:bifunctional salicylyl-CoA 5-hydroxylase/oxidoreductase [Polaromonas naphthalenivorans]|uniref:NADH:flavin oxidoreductase/NADH oxidase n=1 Tax=Polaromonas naphthalenivorans (strain CJ2) TaxID=365044 RepID=A1VTD5_POLNA|nr:bifunctional salicylyl-CoA 5-hydroxylase/oxidoreductase [Polaromonas naphthalenivorans]ABM38913.1 NADH:flavin oxidoreductase/NADH oxidase [Polaromonas naphthalenivorans CJ2]
MHILCLGGGPAGLYFGLLMKRQDPAHRITVVERNRPFDTFGWGVVLSDQTLGNLQAADPVSAKLIGDAFNHWDDVEMFFKGRSVRSGGHGFCGIGRKRLLNILQDRCLDLGVELEFETDVQDDQAIAAQYQADLVIASDGLNSRIRSRYADTYRPDVELRNCRFVWLGTRKTFDAFTFAFEQTEHGWFAAHAYTFDASTSTFIVETPEAVWKAHGLDRMSQQDGIAFCERLFARYLDGHALMNNATHVRGSAIWIRFPRVVCERWVHFESIDGRRVPIVLMGDAAHTAHFSIGSGTKLALEDAIELARCLAAQPGLDAALQAYEAVRSVEVLKIQNAARNSTEWFENVNRYSGLEAEQFFYSMMTRSQRISHENLRVRDAAWLQGYEQWLAEKAPTLFTSCNALPPGGVAAPAVRQSRSHGPGLKDEAPSKGGPRQAEDERESVASVRASPPPPMLLPLKVRELELKNRIVVSPMAMYSAVDGVPQDFHLVHLGARALGGAALVFVEMTAPCAEGRITPGCTGLWNDVQMLAFKRIADFVHASGTDAKIGMQLGHSGPKGSTQVGWEAPDEPLPDGNWPLLAASAVAYGPNNQRPAAMTRADMERIKAEFVQATRRAAEAGFDWLELHCAHGYLLSSFITPLTNLRGDAWGGSLENRCRYPLEVFSAMRAVWPEHLPMSVRISAHDWAPGGNTGDDAVAIARLFKAAGCDFIDVSSGQTTRAARPVYGRMYQTPFADRIRNEAGIQTIAVGAISEVDHVNSIIAAGRADLCAIARPHLADPAWTLHEAAKLQSRHVQWPQPYLSGRDQLYREISKQNKASAQ